MIRGFQIFCGHLKARPPVHALVHMALPIG